MTPRDGVGRIVREAREARDMRQEDLAREAGVRTTTVSRLERGVQTPTEATLRRLARALELPAEELLSAPADGPAQSRRLLEQVAATVETLTEGQTQILAAQETIVAALSRLEAAAATRSASRKNTRA